MRNSIVVSTAALGLLIALLIPAMASAAGELAIEEEPLEVGTVVIGTSTNTTMESEAGTTKCEFFESESELTGNESEGSEFESGDIVTSGCVFGGFLPVTASDFTLFNERITKVGSSTGYTYFANFGGSLTCHYSGILPLTYTTNTDTIRVMGSVASKGAGCPTPTLIDQTITYTTTNGTPVTIL